MSLHFEPPRVAFVSISFLLAACGGSSDATTSDAAPSETSTASDTAPKDTAPPPPDPCVEAGNCTPGVWVNVTPTNVNLTDDLDCGNYGVDSVQVDPTTPSDLYAQFNCQGIWKSTDYGQTWRGPINTGTGGAGANGAGAITIPSAATTKPVPIYSAAIRGSGLGFWKSIDGGVSFTQYKIDPTPDRQGYYAPATDPYDALHLIMAGHEMDAVVESTDGGEHWTSVHLEAGMMEPGGTAAVFFLDTGAAATTRGTWLWMAQGSGGDYGTWRTTNAGVAWTQVDKNEHGHGTSQLFQPGGGVVFMPGVYSALGWGVLRSSDYGQTWTHVGGTGNENLVFGTSKNVYAMNGWASLGPVDPSLEIAPMPGDGTWTPTPTPAEMTHGPAQVAVIHDDKSAILVAACWTSGLWRYIEP